MSELIQTCSNICYCTCASWPISPIDGLSAYRVTSRHSDIGRQSADKLAIQVSPQRLIRLRAISRSPFIPTSPVVSPTGFVLNSDKSTPADLSLRKKPHRCASRSDSKGADAAQGKRAQRRQRIRPGGTIRPIASAIQGQRRHHRVRDGRQQQRPRCAIPRQRRRQRGSPQPGPRG